MGQIEVLFDAVQETSPEDTDKINRIAKGAYDLMREFSIMGHGNLMNIQTVAIDLTVVHAKTPLRLDDMLAALDAERKGDLLHDIIGIANNLDRSTGELANCFMPRFVKY